MVNHEFTITITVAYEDEMTSEEIARTELSMNGCISVSDLIPLMDTHLPHKSWTTLVSKPTFTLLYSDSEKG